MKTLYKSFIFNIDSSSENSLSFQDFKEKNPQNRNTETKNVRLYSQIGSFVARYARLKDVSLITFDNFKGEKITLFKAPYTMIQELTEDAINGKGDWSFIPKIRNMFPKNKELQNLLDKIENLN